MIDLKSRRGLLRLFFRPHAAAGALRRPWGTTEGGLANGRAREAVQQQSGPSSRAEKEVDVHQGAHATPATGRHARDQDHQKRAAGPRLQCNRRRVVALLSLLAAYLRRRRENLRTRTAVPNKEQRGATRAGALVSERSL